jgi:WhiB family redox-sensing transcriptional regulator
MFTAYYDTKNSKYCIYACLDRIIFMMDTLWMAEGKCKDLPPETFFPSDGVGVDVARRICKDCPVKSPCLEYAIANHIDHGVWGGASERERRRIARQRRQLHLISGDR